MCHPLVAVGAVDLMGEGSERDTYIAANRREFAAAANLREWFIVRCTRCGHTWDEEDPEAEVCACIDTYGSREVIVVSAGASNV